MANSAYLNKIRREIPNTNSFISTSFDTYNTNSFNSTWNNTAHVIIDPNITGNEVQIALDNIGITVNKNCVPNEKRSHKETSGIRIGSPAMTTKGYKEADFIRVAHKIDFVIKRLVKQKENNSK